MHSKQLSFQDICDLGQENIVAPDTDMVLRPTVTLCLDDMEFKEASRSMRFVHNAVSRSVAESIGISTKKRKFVQDCSKGIPFEQREELVTRLKGLLHGYPCDIGILKELIQNADDANASEIHFIIDFRTHGCDAIFDSFEEFQGPSLLVYNDSAFTKADLDGLQNLGVGSKNADPSKTGQYGIGFNAVYNLTDLPSFLTKGPEIEGGETLCILDPLQKHCVDYVGMRYDLTAVRLAFPDVVSWYNEEHCFGSDRCGTMFRFPLRQGESALGKCVTKEMMQSILETLKADMRDILLFLRKVKKITVSDISDGTLKTEYSVNAECNENAISQRNRFSLHCKERAKALKREKTHASLSPTVNVSYRLLTTDNIGKQQEWIIIQWLGIDENKVTTEVKNAMADGKLGMLPIGGVAVNLPEEKHTPSFVWSSLLGTSKQQDVHDGKKIYCFLPLPIKSGLPMHINGHFALDHEARRSLWMENEGFRSAWNELILFSTVAPSYIEALKCLKLILFDNETTNYTAAQIREKLTRFQQYFPIAKNAHDAYEKYFVKSVYETIISDKEELFPVAFPVQRTDENTSSKNARQSNLSQKETNERSQVTYRLEWTAFHPTGHQFPVFCTSLSDNVFKRPPLSADSVKRSSMSNTTFRRSPVATTLLSGPFVLDTTLSGSFDDFLKVLGLKVVSLTNEIIETLADTKCGICGVDANAMVQFLKSHTASTFDRIKLGPLPSPVDKTVFAKVRNVERVIHFCAKAESFKNEVDGLPILVTNDGVLRCFDIHQTFYCSRICDLFQKSASRFVHKDIVTTIGSLNVVGIKTSISMEELECFLGVEVDREVFTGSDMVAFEDIEEINYTWIYRLWKFITEKYQAANTKQQNQVSKTNQQHQNSTAGQQDISFDDYTRPLQNWCLLPVVKGDGTQALMKISQMDTVLNMESFENLPPLKHVLSKLRLPRLDRESLLLDAPKELEKHLASSNTPVTLLLCLRSYKERFRNTGLIENDCFAVLNFFLDNLSSMQGKAETWWMIQAIKELPFFVTHDGLCVSVENADVRVLREDMPIDGISEWAENTGKTLLRENHNLKGLYTFLQFSFTGIIQFYSNELLQSWHYLPQGSMMKHLEYIRNHLLVKGAGQEYSEQQERLIHILTGVSVIPVNNTRKKASEFFWPSNDIFKLFCSKEEFPPAEFKEEQWDEFLKLIGMKSNVTDVMFVEFARQVSREGIYKVTETTTDKSAALVMFLMQNTLKWNADVYSHISAIKFIVPYEAQTRYLEVHKQSTENQNLICLKGSISYCHEGLIWTSLPMLPQTADPNYYYHHDPDVRQTYELAFGIHHRPPVDSVVLHCQNVCDSLKICLSNSEVRLSLYTWLASFMEEIYNYLQKHGRDSERSRSRLYHTPVIFLPDRQTMVPAHQTVVTIMAEQEIAPYLLQTPRIYGKFSDLFIYLGAADRPNYMLYVNVLADIRRYVGDKVLGKEYLSEWLAISGAVDNLMKQVSDGMSVNSPPINTVLYLPTRDKKLLDSSTVIVSDNGLRELRISDATDLQYFIGFKELGTLGHDTMDIDRLPKQIRPKRLTQITREEIDTEEMIEVVGCEEATKIERFLQSPHFIEGVLRLLKHAKKKSVEILKAEEEASISSALQNVQVRCVTGLKTAIYLKGERINNSERPMRSYFVFHDERWRVYFQNAQGDTSRTERLSTIHDCLLRFITKITGNTLRDNVIETYNLIQMINNASEISLMLDSLNIDAYDLSQNMLFSVFPPPGTYVPVECHHLLDFEFSVFGVHEYRCVAFELEDRILFDNLEVSDSYNPVYIYVQIMNKIPSKDSDSLHGDRYMIYTGDAYIEVSSSHLYKLLRGPSDTDSNELVCAEGVSRSSLSPETMNKEKYAIRFHLLAAWKCTEKSDRKRIVGRLLRQYHPDKNLGNEDMYKELFVYLKTCISRLENGMTLDNEIDESSQQSRAYPDFSSSSYFEFVQRMSTRSERQRAHVRDYYRADQPYHGNTNSRFRNPHSDSNTKTCPDSWEAKRWYSQAKVDLRNACDTIDTPVEPNNIPAYNWICYMCHQVISIEQIVRYNDIFSVCIKLCSKCFETNEPKHSKGILILNQEYIFNLYVL